MIYIFIVVLLVLYIIGVISCAAVIIPLYYYTNRQSEQEKWFASAVKISFLSWFGYYCTLEAMKAR